MARLLGIDSTAQTTRLAVVRTSYKKLTIESLRKFPTEEADEVLRALRSERFDGVSVSFPGESVFYRRLDIPKAAQRELESVLAFELESGIPLELDETVFDKRMLPAGPDPEHLQLFVAAAKLEQVRARVDWIRGVLSREVDAVDPGSVSLANLTQLVPGSATLGAGSIALLDLGTTRSEVLILDRSEPAFARTISRGTEGLPETAPLIMRELRQTFSAYKSVTGVSPSMVYLVGESAGVLHAETFLAQHLGLPVSQLQLTWTGATDEERRAAPEFAKAIGIALAAEGKSKSLNLRQGELALARSFAFLRDKAPLLVGLLLVIMVSFVFKSVAELRAISTERTILDEQLKVTTKSAFGEETLDLGRANELLEKGPGGEEDPFPHVDAFDVMTQLSKAVPSDVEHDVAELDINRGHAVIQGVIPSGGDAQATVDKIAATMREHTCLRDVKVSKISQSGADKQKYILEMDLRCEDKKKKGTSTTEPKNEKEEN